MVKTKTQICFEWYSKAAFREIVRSWKVRGTGARGHGGVMKGEVEGAHGGVMNDDDEYDRL